MIVHSDARTPPARDAVAKLAVRLAAEEFRVLVFINGDDPGLFGSWRAVGGRDCMPQGLASLAFNLPTTTLVYLDFQSRVRWRFVNYLQS